MMDNAIQRLHALCQPLARMTRSLQRFWHARDGVATIMVTVAGTVLATSGLLAFDIARVHMAISRAQTAIDASVLAATRDIDSLTLTTDIRQIFDANFPPGYLGSSITRFHPQTVSFFGLIESVELDVDIEVPSMVASTLGTMAGKFNVLKMEGKAERQSRGSEIALVLDNTGSMFWNDNIGELRIAAKALLDILFHGEETIPGLYMSVVPYTAHVNIGLQHSSWVNDPAVNPILPNAWTDYLPTTWKGCVHARLSPLDEGVATPATQAFDPTFWESVYANGMAGEDAGDPPNVYKAQGDWNTWPDHSGAIAEAPAGDATYGPNMNCPDPITPLTASYTTLYNAVDRMVHWWNGGTFANFGLVWGWRSIAPEWRGYWRHENGNPISFLRPFSYSNFLSQKIIVLMTDGLNEWVPGNLTSYGREDWDWLAVGTPGAPMKAELDARMASSCATIKAQGIAVFTITLGTAPSAATQQLFSDCASEENDFPHLPGQKYFHAEVGTDLNDIFTAIGSQMTELRLVK